MCYCCRKLEILCILYVWEAEFGRPWEAVWGRGALIGLEICVRESQIFGANQSPTASHGLSRPLTASHNLSCDLSEPIRGARPLTRTASQISDSQICEAVGVRSDSTSRSNAFSREISQTGPRMTASPGVRERPIGLSNLWGRSVRPWESDASDWFHG